MGDARMRQMDPTLVVQMGHMPLRDGRYKLSDEHNGIIPVKLALPRKPGTGAGMMGGTL